MKRDVCLTLLCLLLAFKGLPSQSAGYLDLSFQGTGYRIEPFASDDFPGAIVVLPDGRIVVAGTDIHTQPGGIAVRRYWDNGDPDSSFGTNGYTLANTREVEGVVLGLGAQSDGKLILVGGQQQPWDLIVERLDVNGALDLSFGQSGVATAFMGQGAQYGMRAFVSPDDKILLGYFKGQGFQRSLGACRLLPNGAIDSTYGVNGYASMSIAGSFLRHNATALDASQRLVFGGTRGSSLPSGNFLARLDANGVPDSSFGTNGAVMIPNGHFDNDLIDVAAHPDGSTYVMGYVAAQPFYSVIAIRRYDASGQPDSTFGSAGASQIASTQGSMEGAQLLVDLDGNLVVAGGFQGANTQFMVARMYPDGTLDTRISPDGWVAHPFGADWSSCRAGVLDPQGRLVMAGLSFSAGTDRYCTVARLGMGAPLGVLPPGFSLWPNVTSIGVVTIGFEAWVPGTLQYAIVDMQGRQVVANTEGLHLAQGKHQIPVKLENIASGIYLVQVLFDGMKLTRKLIVQ